MDLNVLLQLLIENKAYYLEIKAGLVQYLERFLQATLEKISNFVFFDCPRANTTRKHAASRQMPINSRATEKGK